MVQGLPASCTQLTHFPPLHRCDPEQSELLVQELRATQLPFLHTPPPQSDVAASVHPCPDLSPPPQFPPLQAQEYVPVAGAPHAGGVAEQVQDQVPCVCTEPTHDPSHVYVPLTLQLE